MCLRAKRKNPSTRLGLFILTPGDDRLSHAVTRAVPWALEGLTTVFGMGTGVAPPVRSPENFLRTGVRSQKSGVRIKTKLTSGGCPCPTDNAVSFARQPTGATVLQRRVGIQNSDF